MSSPVEQPSPALPPVHSAAWWLEAVTVEERRGELLSAFDLAERGLAEHPDDLSLKHRAVLALARTGATEEAEARFIQYGLARVENEDVAALRARIAKDVALASEGAERGVAAASAAERYGAIFERTGGYYPAINAATLWLLAGNPQQSRELAAQVLDLLAASREDSYYAAATAGEAHLLRGDERAARDALERAAARHEEDYSALATTRRQLRMICGLLGIDAQLLGVLAGPAVVHYCGHRIASDADGGSFVASLEASVAARIAAEVQQLAAGYAYGSLASGADILWAEALLANGSELNVVLPFAREEFIERSVADAGGDWVERFHRCMDAAVAVLYATDDAFLGDNVLFRYGSELAMGLALLRGRYLDAEVRQLTVWDGRPSRAAAGTAIDVATWRQTGRPTLFVSPVAGPPAIDFANAARAEEHAASPEEPSMQSRASCAEQTASRVVRAMLFGDFKGFSKLADEQLPRFAERVLGALAGVLERYQAAVWHRNTWGDALYVVLTDAPVAAACALDLQEAMSRIELASEGLPEHLALRLGGHVGPVFPTRDPVLDEPVFMGSHVSRTARIEPVTPPGAAYVTEPFAAALELHGAREFLCDYVGHMAAAKDYGRLRMYRLRRAPAGATRA